MTAAEKCHKQDHHPHSGIPGASLLVSIIKGYT